MNNALTSLCRKWKCIYNVHMAVDYRPKGGSRADNTVQGLVPLMPSDSRVPINMYSHVTCSKLECVPLWVTRGNSWVTQDCFGVTTSEIE